MGFRFGMTQWTTNKRKLTVEDLSITVAARSVVRLGVQGGSKTSTREDARGMFLARLS